MGGCGPLQNGRVPVNACGSNVSEGSGKEWDKN